MKSIILSAAYSIAFASFLLVLAPKNSNRSIQNSKVDAYPAATGIMLNEVTISSLPTFMMNEVVVSTDSTIEFTLPEVVIFATDKP
jgi:hypothetical protein